jgi:hypothetical protein
MPLEPSDGQIEAACLAMETADLHAHPTAAGMRVVFALVRDMALEEAAKVCTTVVQECPLGSREGAVAVVCASRIRAMKGKPPG